MNFFWKIKNFFMNLFKKAPKLEGPKEPAKELPPFSPERTPLGTALEITGDFETEGDPWTQITGNFDGEGASLGILQWNFGQNSIQPLIRRAQLHILKKYCPKYWIDIWNAAMTSGTSEVSDWNLRAMGPELKAYLGSPEFKAVQVEAAQAKEKATLQAGKSFYSEPLTIQQFCFFFDIMVQSGSLKGLARGELDSFIARKNGIKNAKDFVCRWAIESGDSNAVACGKLWEKDSGGNWELLIIGYLRAMLSKPQWQGNAFARRGTIAMGYGVVENERKDYRKFMGLTS